MPRLVPGRKAQGQVDTLAGGHLGVEQPRTPLHRGGVAVFPENVAEVDAGVLARLEMPGPHRSVVGPHTDSPRPIARDPARHIERLQGSTVFPWAIVALHPAPEGGG